MIDMNKVLNILGVAAAFGTALIAGKMLHRRGYAKGYDQALRDSDEMGVF